MARSIRYLLSLIPLGFLMTGHAAGQAAVEAGLGASRAATMAAPAKGIGKSISGLAGSLDKTIQAGQKGSDAPASVTTVRVLSPSGKQPAPAASKWEDPSGIQTGLSYADLVRRFGPPSMAITGETGMSLIYLGKAGTFQLEVREDKVASVEKPKS